MSMMRLILAVGVSLLLLTQAVSAKSLGGFDSFSSARQSLLNSVVSQLGIEDRNDRIKVKIHDQIKIALEGDWYSYWIGLSDLAKSKYQDDNAKGFIQVLLATEDSGIWIITLAKKEKVDQIVLSLAQIRHGAQDGALEVYNAKKNDSENFEIKSESDKYAFIQEKGKVTFSLINVGNGTGSVTYVNQVVIDL